MFVCRTPSAPSVPHRRQVCPTIGLIALESAASPPAPFVSAVWTLMSCGPLPWS